MHHLRFVCSIKQTEEVKMLVIAALSIILAVSYCDTLATGVDRTIVHLDHGAIQGILQKSRNGREFYSFRSIPFAKPPVGDLRLMDPQPAEPWEGVLDGTRPPPKCPQQLRTLFIQGSDFGGQEDCLYLNVFSAEPDNPEAVLPVMVFIHGGGFLRGTSQPYVPDTLLDEDVVLVTIQYRFGVLGFLSTEDEVIPGNFGLKDQTLALRWVHENIARFGGDPHTVTIFGESAGSASVDYQILTPYSEGLFSRAILHSGTTLCPWANGVSFRKLAEYVGDKVNCSLRESVEGSRRFLECLRKVDFNAISPIYNDFLQFSALPLVFSPRVDGDYIPMHPAKMVKHGLHKKVDIITGVTTDEGATFLLDAFAQNQFKSLQEDFDTVAPAFLEFSRKEDNALELAKAVFDQYLRGKALTEEATDELKRMIDSHHFFVCNDLSTMYYAHNMSPTKNVFTYVLSYRPTKSVLDNFARQFNKTWVGHFDDLIFLFNGPGFYVTTDDEDDLKVSHMMTQMWTSFASTGNPTPNDSLGFTWRPTTDSSLLYLDINLTPTMKADAHKEALKFWKGLPTRQNRILHQTGTESREEL